MNYGKAASRIAAILLTIAIVAGGFPYFHPNDDNRDGSVGIEDAVVALKAVLENPDMDLIAAQHRMQAAMTAIEAAAGLRPVFSQDDAQSIQTKCVDNGIHATLNYPENSGITPLMTQMIPRQALWAPSLPSPPPEIS